MGFTNTERFSEQALHFKEYGVYTKDPIGSKAWINFWKQEKDRCLNGLNLGYDKITGYHYNLLNYSPILQTKVIKESLEEFGQNQAERIKDFARFQDGQYDFFWYLQEAEEGGEHAMLLGSRGKGKSIMAASLGARNYHFIRDSKSYYVASRENYLLGDGILPKVYSLISFVDQNTPFGKSRDEKDTEWHKRSSKKIKNAAGIWTIHPKSYNSEIIGITMGDDPNKTRGIRGKIIVYEEFGSNKKGNIGWNINRPSMEDGRNTFGLMLAICTGGDEGGFDSADELFYNPEAYRIHPTQNIYDEGMENTTCAFFYPAQRNYGGAQDKDGNSDIEKAIKFIDADRKLVATGNDPHALTRRKAEYCKTPREACMRISGTQFPIDQLKTQEGEIVSKPHIYKNADFIGKLELNKETQKFEWKTDLTLTPIYQFPMKDNKNLPGAIIIYSHPSLDSRNIVYPNRYYIGIDSYDFDDSTTTSLGSCFVGDSWTRKIVAEYTGRPKTREEFYEGCRRLALYYDARCMIEGFNLGIFNYFDDKNSGYLIADEPRVAKEMLDDGTISKYNGKRRRGFMPNKKLNATLRGWVAQWMLESTNNPEAPEEIQLHKFRCLPAIKEAILWNPDLNTDRISALGALMLIFQDREKYTIETEENYKSLKDDKWFAKNYGGRRQ